ncbi:MAG: hypothetical protein ACI4DS_05700 [Eubacterium sp.]
MEKEMNEVITQLSKIEAASAKIMEATKIEEENYAAYIEQQKKEFDDALNKETDLKVEALRADLEMRNTKELSDFKTAAENHLKSLDNKYEKNHTKWAQNILQDLIKE